MVIKWDASGLRCALHRVSKHPSEWEGSTSNSKVRPITPSWSPRNPPPPSYVLPGSWETSSSLVTAMCQCNLAPHFIEPSRWTTARAPSTAWEEMWNCLFYKPAGEALSTPDPVECFQALADHATMTGRKFEPGYAAAFESFAEILSSRKEGLAGNWFTAPGGTGISCCTWSPLSLRNDRPFGPLKCKLKNIKNQKANPGCHTMIVAS